MKIELRDVSLAYGDEAPVLRGLSLEAAPGDLVVIEGASGAGKSSLLRLLNRLQDPTAGEVLVDAAPIASGDVTALRRRIAYVPQTPAMPPGTVLENLRLPFRFRAAGGAAPPGPERVRELLDGLRLDHVRPDDDATRLSVGEKQRVALARALLTEPEALLCDEPTSALDEESGRIVEGTLERLCAEHGLTAVVVTHRPLRLARVRPRRFRLVRGAGLTEIVP